MGLSPAELQSLRNMFLDMDEVALLEYAYDALANGPVISEELQTLRWNEFGRLADALVEAPARTPRWHSRKLDELRDFCFLEALMRLESSHGNLLAVIVKSPMHLLAMLVHEIRQFTPDPFGLRPWNN